MPDTTPIAEMIVFLPSAKALTFKNVTILVDDVNLFIFEYASVRDGSKRKAKFAWANIVGWSALV
jgi:hypothetical protein